MYPSVDDDNHGRNGRRLDRNTYENSRQNPEDVSTMTRFKDPGNYRYIRGGSGLNNLMKAYNGSPNFPGAHEEDLENCLKIYETLGKM